MKTRILRSATAVLIVLSLLATVTAYAAGNIVFTNTRLLADNLEYVNTISYCETDGRRESFAVRMTGPGDAFPIVMRGETVFGALTISDMLSRAESMGKNVLAVVNTDFFSMQTGVPMGIVIEDGVYVSSPGGRNAICFADDGSVFYLNEPSVEITLYNHGRADSGEDTEADSEEEADNRGETVILHNLNKFRMDTGGMVMLTEAFSTVSTRTASPGWFVRLRILEGVPSVSGEMTLEVTETIDYDGDIPIGEGYMILTSAHQSGFIAEYEKFAVGDIITMTTRPSDDRLANVLQATGGGDILVSEGLKTDSEQWDSALLPRAPRTAFGVRADGTVISYVIDGRNSAHSVGMTLDELADEMLRQGAVYAVNLDGGGSSAISARLPGESSAIVVSRPSDGAERRCSTYLLFVTDAVPDGAARNLSLSNDGIIILAGSSAELEFTATDRGYMPAAVPGDVRAEPSAPGASIMGTRYTAGILGGADEVTLYSPSSGAAGKGNIVVITTPTSITVTERGSAALLASAELSPGETLEFDLAATYYGRAVISQPHSFTYEISGNIGQMIEPGVFRAGLAEFQTGTITISAGGTQTEISVEVGEHTGHTGFDDMIGHWARDYAEYLFRAGITIGITASEYGPEELMRRGDYILMLHRAAGSPEPGEAESFDDVPGDAYYAQALAWAKETGVARSPAGNMFDPTGPLTRQQAFTFTYHALSILDKQYEDGSFEDLAWFPDAHMLEDYAAIPTATLIRIGIVEGMDGYLSPDSTMTRAQMAKVVTMVMEL